jgi:DNA invertase Pin-like site-specific DNA recombinase
LKDVKNNIIDKGSWIGFEDFDRLSRMNYCDAKEIFEELINAGITVLTFCDGKFYDLQSLRNNPFEFMTSLMSMVGAHDYSDKMSGRSIRNWKAKREAAVTSRKIMTANVPVWIDTIVDEISPSGKKVTQHFELNAEKSAIVRQLIDLFLNGQGCQTIARQFNLQNVQALRNGKYWMPGNVRNILKNSVLCGRYDHQNIVLEDYYPALVSKETYGEIQLLLKSNNNSKTRPINTSANPLQGLCHCSACGSLMTRVSQRAYRGRKPYQKLVCIGAKTGKHTYRSIEVDTVIGHLYMLFTYPASFSFNNDDKLIGLQTKRADYEMRITRLTDEMAIMGGSEAIRRALTGLEADLARLDKLIAEEGSKAVYGNARRMSEVLLAARDAMGGASLGPSFGARLKSGLPLVPTRTTLRSSASQAKTMADPQTMNGLLRRLFKNIKIDIEAQEIWCEWMDGKTSVLTI